MGQEIRRARIHTLERYLRHEEEGRRHDPGDDSGIYSLFLGWYAEPYMKGSRTKTIALAKRMLEELKKEGESNA